MTYSIFCPSSHLILSAPNCPVCGWDSAPAAVGEAAWTPLAFNSGLDSLRPDAFIHPAAADGVAVFPLKNREIIGIETQTGTERWRLKLSEGQVTHQIVADKNRFLLSISDDRPYGKAGQARLASIDARTGQLATLWQDTGHQISAPVLSGQTILIRTISGLVALSQNENPELIWRLPLQTWFDLPPVASDGMVYIFDGNTVQNVGQLLAIDLNNHTRVWSADTDGISMQPVSISPGVIVFQNSRRQILALDAADGELIWKQDFNKLYTPPTRYDGHILCVSRDAAGEAGSTHYSLHALASQTGAIDWQISLPGKVRIPPAQQAGRIFIASSDGQLIAIEPEKPNFLFQKEIGTEQDPPSSGLILDGNVLLSCSASGILTAIQVAKNTPIPPGSPTEYLAENDFEQAAAAYALQGDFKSAAALYVNPLHDVKKALVLYDCAGLYNEAATLSTEHGMLSEAEYYYQLAGDPLNQAKIILQRSDETGNKAVYVGQLRRAVELLNKVGQDDHELDTLLKLAEIKPENVLFERIIKLAKICERHFDEAQTWEHLHNPLNAAEAYRRAGVQAEQDKPQNKPLIIQYFSKAAFFFSECGMEADFFQCQNEIAMLGEFPVINIKIKPDFELTEGKWNVITLIIQNLGFGIAQSVSWRFESDRFDVDLNTGVWSLNAIAIGAEKEIKIHIRAKTGEIGEAVPLVMVWQWNHPDGKTILHRAGTSLKVKENPLLHPTNPPAKKEKPETREDRHSIRDQRLKRLGRKR